MAISGATVVVSAGGLASQGGRAYVFAENHGSWAPVAQLNGQPSLHWVAATIVSAVAAAPGDSPESARLP